MRSPRRFGERGLDGGRTNARIGHFQNFGAVGKPRNGEAKPKVSGEKRIALAAWAGLNGAMLAALPILVAFLAGSVPFGLILAKFRGVDLRAVGSGNIGATNVWRAMGKGFGSVCFVLDFLKGLLPVLWALQFGPTQAHAGHSWLEVGTGLAAVLGHNYSPFAGFKGGKGVATSAGVLVGLMPWVVLPVLLVWWLTLKASRMVGLASVVAAAALPLVYLGLGLLPAGTLPGFRFDWIHFGFAALVAVLVIWRHKSNLRRIFDGTEGKVGAGKGSAQS